MKQLTPLFIALLSLLAAGAHAQDFINFGPKAGFSVNRFQDLQEADRITYSSFNTVSAGLFARLNPGRLYLQPEVYYLVKGSNFTRQDADRSSGSIRLQTLDAPLLLGYHFIKGTGFNLRAFAGPVFNLYTKESQNDLRPWDPERYAIREGVPSAQAGVGVDLLMLTLDARWERGLRKINDELGVRPSQFTISVGYKLF
ncbi:porin family protein [Cesiribacter andamanensis]|uniref:Outer membrane protein beta-barrel domain-containing protein n=1 Tax=Cesiribacter andamanensis AMV16 TaxID=1279009 RepID=M7N3X3_9BACT|nr:porin family protein [Cesiribacter andamanensis]EMR01992.1 hypothetical protein ADICEAN_02884 [Cesiribacter andamanensis AMV16]